MCTTFRSHPGCRHDSTPQTYSLAPPATPLLTRRTAVSPLELAASPLAWAFTPSPTKFMFRAARKTTQKVYPFDLFMVDCFGQPTLLSALFIG